MNDSTRRLSEHLQALRVVPQRRRSRLGMTLMEVMIVIAIILLLMGTLAIGLRSSLMSAQEDMAAITINRISEKIKIHQIKKKKLPDSLEQVFRGEDVPMDPWSNPFIYRKSGGKDGYDIISYGSDGKEGGSPGDGADIKLSEM